MEDFIKQIMPNVYAYRTRFFTSLDQMLQMFFIAGIISFILGLFFGVLLTVTKPDGIRQNRLVYRIVDIVINVFRAIPFVILLIFLIPFTRFLVGTAIGEPARSCRWCLARCRSSPARWRPRSRA